MTESELLIQQQNLQNEANEIASELKLDALLQTVGNPVRVGSSALGLMIWRDLDVTVTCSKLNISSISQIASDLMGRTGVREVRFLNDTGNWNTDPNYPDGLYLGLKYMSQKGMDWNLDIWFVDEPEKQPDLLHLRTIQGRLTPEFRISILKIKKIWATRPEYRNVVKSFDIYTAVLDDNVRTPSQFEEWLKRK